MKNVLVMLSSDSCAKREIISGVFDFVNTGKDWNLRLDTMHSRSLKSIGQRIDGVITGFSRFNPVLDGLIKSRVPTVLTNFPPNMKIPRGAPISVVRNDDKEIGRMAARYLHSKGAFRSYGFIAEAEESTWQSFRRTGYALELSRWGIVPTSRKLNDKDLCSWLQDLPKPAAILASYDNVALNISEICHRLKLAIPSQVTLLGVDNDELICNSTKPRLSSIQTNHIEIGRRSAENMEKIMMKRRAGKTIYVRPIEVIERESSRTISPSGSLIDRALKIIRTNHQKGITPADVALQLGVSAPLLRLRFRQVFGKSVRNTIIESRINTALHLLKDTDRRITQIATDIGFSSLHAFTHFFTTHTGSSPSGYRRNRLQPSRG